MTVPITPSDRGDMIVGTEYGNILDWSTTSIDDSIKTIQILGDSNWTGSNGADTGMVAVGQSALYEQLRAYRDDFDFVGTFAAIPEQVATLGLQRTQALAGAGLVSAAAAYAGYIAVMGRTNYVLMMLGAAELITGGKTAAAMFADFQALDTVIQNANVETTIVVMGIAPFVAGTTVGGNLAAWTATRAQFNAMVKNYCLQNRRNHIYLDITDQLGPGDFQVDGVHLNQLGQARMGQAVALKLDYYFGRRRGNQLSNNVFLQRKPWASESLPVAATSTLTAVAHNGFCPESGGFAVAFDFYPTTLDAGGLHSLIQYGAYGAPLDFWSIFQQGKALRIYWNDPAGTIVAPSAQASEVALILNTWHRIVLIAANNSVGLYVNGKMVGFAINLAAWNIALGLNTVLGNRDVTGCPGYYARVHAYKDNGPGGGIIPKPGSMQALQAVEQDYYKGRDLFPGLGSAVYNINSGLNSDISGQAALVAAGGAVAIAAYPTGPAKPWEYVGA